MKPRLGPSLFFILGIIGCGAFAFILSYYFSLEHLAIIGLGLVSWGLIFLYIRPRELISSENLVMAISSIKAVDKLLVDSGYLGKGIYLPSQYLRGSKECQVFVPRIKKRDGPGRGFILFAYSLLLCSNDSRHLCFSR